MYILVLDLLPPLKKHTKPIKLVDLSARKRIATKVQIYNCRVCKKCCGDRLRIGLCKMCAGHLDVIIFKRKGFQLLKLAYLFWQGYYHVVVEV